MAIGTNCHNYCNSKSEHWLAVEIAIASQTETAFAEQPGEGACVFVLGLDFICVFYPSSFLRILKNNFFPTWNTGGNQEVGIKSGEVTFN